LFSNHIRNIQKIKRPLRRRQRPSASASGYQACEARQCGQATVVETGARNTNPHEHA
jgi:hypothetical protein